jgi:hypothetical protein
MLDTISRSLHSYRVELYLPDNDCFGDTVPDIEEWVRDACRVLVALTGGATRMAPATGMWLNKELNILIEETTHVVYSYFDARDVEQTFRRVRTFLCEFGRQTGQQSVAVEFAGKMLFISDFEDRSPHRSRNEVSALPLLAS